jgi:hypothetical protein
MKMDLRQQSGDIADRRGVAGCENRQSMLGCSIHGIDLTAQDRMR